MNQPRARWVVPELNPRRASLRYRCLYPMAELARQGRDVGLYREGEPIDAGLTIIFDAWTLFPSVREPARSEALLGLA